MECVYSVIIRGRDLAKTETSRAVTEKACKKGHVRSPWHKIIRRVQTSCEYGALVCCYIRDGIQLLQRQLISDQSVNDIIGDLSSVLPPGCRAASCNSDGEYDREFEQ